ncbi:Glycosyl transferase family 2 [Polaribacter sp. KT25b]|uniref:glycosyltransferase n=1 Tax=Polaribacter sp. KT25b TaxID=1855336 RepID=UPI00087A3F09|nr:glycosyltransferase [Polaribacter sp. KT25b]SDS06782.1 Glycosyl transferase family 2 [Polaribacter sp. KT25b]
MNSGVIIVFSNNEKEISNFNTEYLSNINASKICFVNNASSDNTLNLLKDIQFKSEKNISILDIKLNKGLKAAIKYGARLLLSESEFDFIVYLKPNMLDSLPSLTTFLKNFQENKQDYTSLPTRSSRNVLFDVFSIQEIMKKKSVA